MKSEEKYIERKKLTLYAPHKGKRNSVTIIRFRGSAGGIGISVGIGIGCPCRFGSQLLRTVRSQNFVEAT
jgi:hypothetical protein